MSFNFQRSNVTVDSTGNYVYVNQNSSVIPDLNTAIVDWYAGCWASFPDGTLGYETYSYITRYGYSNTPNPTSLNDIRWVVSIRNDYTYHSGGQWFDCYYTLFNNTTFIQAFNRIDSPIGRQEYGVSTSDTNVGQYISSQYATDVCKYYCFHQTENVGILTTWNLSRNDIVNIMNDGYVYLCVAHQGGIDEDYIDENNDGIDTGMRIALLNTYGFGFLQEVSKFSNSKVRLERARWASINQVKVKVNGSWKNVKEIKVKSGNTWKNVPNTEEVLPY